MPLLLRSPSCALRPPLQLQSLSCAVRLSLPLRLLTYAVRPPQLLPLMLSPGAPTSVPAGTPSVTPTVVPALRVFARRLIVVFVRRHALATRALRRRTRFGPNAAAVVLAPVRPYALRP